MSGCRRCFDEYFLRFPQFRDQQRVTFFFDEPQVVPGWEQFIRRIIDTEKTPLSGKPTLIQVCTDLSQAEVREREFRAFESARDVYRKLPCLLLTTSSTDAAAAQKEAPSGVTVRPAWEWMLEGG